jgi:MATE family multidrug resistance protein
MGFRNLLEIGSWSVFTGIVARTGEAHLAAHVIAIRIISVSFLPGHGISEAACVLTGQAVGAGNGEAARRVAKTATNVCLVAMGACAVVFLFFGSELVGLFRNDPRVLETGARLLLIAAGFQLFDAVAMVKIGALNGAGDTRYVMFANVALAWLVLLPVGWGFCRAAGWGAPGAWVGITAEVAVLALVLSLRWRGSRPFEGALRQQAA